MKFVVKHEIPGRIRIHAAQKRMTCTEADTLLYYLNTLEYVTQAKVYERTADACVCFTGDSDALIQAIRKFRYESVEVPEAVLASSGRKYQDELKRCAFEISSVDASMQAIRDLLKKDEKKSH